MTTEQKGKLNASAASADFGSEPGNGGKEINLVELLYRFYEKSVFIILALVIGAAIAGIYSNWFAVPRYESTAKLYVLNSDNSILDLSDLQIGSYLTADYQEVFKAWEVNEQVLQNLGLDYSYGELAKMVTVSNPTDTRILYITVTSESAEQSVLMANEYAEVARKYISETMQTKTPSILSTALISAIPVSPNIPLNVAAGALSGVIIAVTIVFIMFLTDDKVKSEEDIMKYCGLVTLAVVPCVDRAEAKKNNKRIKASMQKEGAR